MSDNTPVDSDFNLDSFSAELFGQSQTDQEAATPDEAPEDDPVEDAPQEDTHSGDDDTPDTEVDETEADPVEEKPKKTRFQERIDELTGKQREAERRASELEAKLNEAIAKLNQSADPKPAKVEAEDSSEPKHSDLNEDGTDKYPLGEFDAKFLKDYTMYHIAQREAATKESETQTAEQARLQKEHEARQTAWEAKLEPARERYPDYQEKVEGMISTLSDIEPTYGDYLSSQIMEMDHGTEVLYYLATHPAEARSIVDSGARKATLALGALEERLRPRSEEPVFKATKAPTPPPTNKGTAGQKAPIRGDEDDLDAFARALFKQGR